MARSKSPSRAQPLAIELLESDHRKVEALFKQYEEEKDGDEDTKRPIAEQICAELSVHAQVEEEIFYPWLRENLSEEDMELLEEAIVEHSTAKDLIAQLEGAGEIDETYDAKVKVLSEYIKHHVKEEEGEIFPKVSDMKEELDEVGQQMAARKSELAGEHGLMEDEEAQPAAGAMSKRGKPGQRGAQRGAR